MLFICRTKMNQYNQFGEPIENNQNNEGDQNQEQAVQGKLWEKINNRALESFDSTGYFVVKLQLSRKVHFSKKRNHNNAK